MSRKRKAESGVKMVLPGWMASYADLFTVMMVFFILLFAMSQIDQDLFERFIASFNPARDQEVSLFDGHGDIHAHDGAGVMPYVVPPEDEGQEGDPNDETGVEALGDTTGDMMNTFMTYMATLSPVAPPSYDPYSDPTIHPYGFGIQATDDYVRIIIGEAYGTRGEMPFNSGQARLTPSAIATLSELGPILEYFSRGNHGIAVEGHTDNQPISTAVFPSNWTLSGARAAAVVEHLVNNFDINVQMITGVARGEYFPVGDNNTAEGRAQNRRVEIKVFTQGTTAGGVIGGWFRIPGTE